MSNHEVAAALARAANDLAGRRRVDRSRSVSSAKNLSSSERGRAAEEVLVAAGGEPRALLLAYRTEGYACQRVGEGSETT